MINYIKEQLALRRLRKQLQAQNQIDPGFLKSARERFVAMAAQRSAGAVVSAPSRGMAWRYATVAIVAVLGIASGLGVFAQIYDVPPDSPLYQLKRIGEQVQLAVSSPAKQAELHQLYAARRLKEIAIIKAEDTSGAVPAHAALPIGNIRIEKRMDITASISSETTLTSRQSRLEKLKEDFQQEAEQAIDQSKNTGDPQAKQLQVCNQILDAVNRASTSVSASAASRLQTRCNEVQEGR